VLDQHLGSLGNLVLCFALAVCPPNYSSPVPGPLTLLRQKQTVSLLDGDAVPRVLVVGREARGVGALGDLAINDLAQRVDALGRVLGVGDVHQMHAATVSIELCLRIFAAAASSNVAPAAGELSADAEREREAPWTAVPREKTYVAGLRRCWAAD
jgi:hypothetical protein